jgi:hypothetical protein
MTNYSTPLLLLTCSAAGISHADDQLLKCHMNAGRLTSCTLVDKIFSDIIQYNGNRYATDFRVDYDFACRGNPVKLGLQSGSSVAFFEMGHIGTAFLKEGNDILKTFDPFPAETTSMSFAKDCILKVSKVSASPSFGTLNIWKKEADELKDQLSVALEDYKLALANSRSTLTTLSRGDLVVNEIELGLLIPMLAKYDLTIDQIVNPDGTIKLAEEHPSDFNLAKIQEPFLLQSLILWKYLNDSIKGIKNTDSTPVTEDDLRAVSSVLVKKSKAKLESSILSAQNVIDRAAFFQSEIEESLRTIITDAEIRIKENNL